MIRIVLIICAWACLAVAAVAETSNLAGLAGIFDDREPMFPGGSGAQGSVTNASLFAGQGRGGLFAPLPGRLDTPLLGGGSSGAVAARLRDLIARAEAGRAGYDAVQHGARIKTPERPTRMTLGEIFAWIDATPGQPHAIGRYQFIPPTLKRLAARLGLGPDTRFGPAVQDRMADLLLADAGLDRVQRGDITTDAFLLNLAKIWAGLPTSSGQSYYHGVAGNKATTSYEAHARQVRAILGG